MSSRALLPLWLLASLPALAQGMLLPTDTNLGPLGIKYQRVSAEIKDGTAVTRVEQVFVNSGPRQLEAHYVFPLPKGAALQDFYLWMNGKKTKGEILEKDKATNIYEGIVRRLRDPGLLEYVDSDVFRARVFPVPANGEQRIELSFSQVLDFQSGMYHYHYPLGASSKGAAPLKVKQDFTFSANLSSKTPIRSVYSPTHKLGVSHKGENAAVAGLELGAGADISKDLDLYYSVSDKAVGLSMMAWKKEDEPGYFLALIAPKTEYQKEEILGKRITFVIDTSGSMAGDRMKLAKDSLKYCLNKLNAQDRFNIVRFSTDVEALYETPKDASGENVKKALSFVDSLEALGGTAIDEALRRALKDGEAQGQGPHLVMFITDGQPTVGETDEAAIARNAQGANKAKSRVFTFGVGEDLNARLLDRIAADGSGSSDFVRDGREFEVKISGFYDQVSHPVLADLAIDFGKMGAYDVYPRKLPDLFKGGQVVVLGRYRAQGGTTVVLSGQVNGNKKVYEYRSELPIDDRKNDFLPRLWAIRKVGYLLEEIRLRGERAELKDEVVTLGKRFGIVTPYTSYLVVEDQPMVAVQNNRPPPPPFQPWGAPRPAEDRPRGGGGRAEAKKSVDRFAPAPSAATPAAESRADFDDEAFAKSSISSGEGAAGVAVSRKMKVMKEEERGPGSSEPVRVAGGRTYVWRLGGWMDSETVDNPGKQLNVKYLSPAYFALLTARPELKAALALGDRVVVVVGKGKSVVVSPDKGEEKAEALQAFLK